MADRDDLMRDLRWYPPSEEGWGNLDEIQSQYGRVTAILKLAADSGDAELVDMAIQTLHQMFGTLLDRLGTD